LNGFLLKKLNGGSKKERMLWKRLPPSSHKFKDDLRTITGALGILTTATVGLNLQHVSRNISMLIPSLQTILALLDCIKLGSDVQIKLKQVL